MRFIRLLGNEIIAPHVLRLTEEKRRHLPVVSRFVLHAFRSRSVSKIVVARESSRSCQVRLARPQSVISRRVAISTLQPRAIFLPGRLLRIINRQNHRGKKRRPRSPQGIFAISIPHPPPLLVL